MRSLRLALPLGGIVALAGTPVFGHGGGAGAPPLLPGVLFTVAPEPLPWLGSIVAAGGYLLLARRINASHRSSQVPVWRVLAWLGGVFTALVALASAIDVYADELLTVHMVQHLLLTMVAPPLLALGAPVTLVLRAVARPPVAGCCSRCSTRASCASPPRRSSPGRSSPPSCGSRTSARSTRRRSSSRPSTSSSTRSSSAPGCSSGGRSSARDPIPHRMGHAARFAYLVVQMPVNAAVGLGIYWAPFVLYPHYLVADAAGGLAARRPAGGRARDVGGRRCAPARRRGRHRRRVDAGRLAAGAPRRWAARGSAKDRAPKAELVATGCTAS